MRQALKLHIVLAVAFWVLLYATGFGQSFKWAARNNAEYDKRPVTYGFAIGIHTTTYQLKYDEDFVTPKFDTVHSVQPEFSPGFSLGFLVNFRINDQLDIRLLPKAGFYEHKLSYFFTNRTSTFQLVETTMVELPILLKYKSQRRGNVRMYAASGFTPAFEARNKTDLESTNSKLQIQKGNLSFDIALGFDLYFPLFKLSPEVRFSKGLLNIFDGGSNAFSDPVKRLNTNTIGVYFIFQ